MEKGLTKVETPKYKRFFFNTLLVVFSLAITLAAVELVFRKIRPAHGELAMGFADSLHHHKLKPNQILPNGFGTTACVNSFGYRGREFTLEKKPGTTRLLFLGDSFTWGSGVNDGEVFPAILDQYFAGRNLPIEVINGAFASYSPIIYFLRMRDEHIRLNPDHVFVFYDLTDLQDDYNYEKHLVYNSKGQIVACNPMYINGRLSLWKVLVAKSSFARYLYNKVVRTLQKIQVIGVKEYIKLKLEGKRTKSYIVNIRSLGKHNLDMLPYDRYIMIRDPSRLPLVEKHWPRSAKYLLMLHDFLAERGISMTLVLYPHGPQVSARQWRTGKVMWGFDEEKVYDDPYAWDLIKNWAQEENVELIDLLPYFKRYGDEELFFDADVHLNAHGHQIFAEALLASDIFQKRIVA